MSMSIGKTILFFIIVTTVAIVTGKGDKRWESSSDCGVEECCTSSNRCKRFIPEGNKCNVFRQIMGDQCPCISGSTCTSTTNELTLKTRMTCQDIVKHDFREIVHGSHDSNRIPTSQALWEKRRTASK